MEVKEGKKGGNHQGAAEEFARRGWIGLNGTGRIVPFALRQTARSRHADGGRVE